MKKLLKALLRIFCILIALVILAAGGYALLQPVIYKEYYTDAKKEFAVLGLKDKIVPQGFAYDKENGVYLYTAYMADGSASRVYIYDGDNYRYVLLTDENGAPHTGHVGGIAAGESKVWIADGDKVWVLEKDELYNSKESITLTQKFVSESTASCCTVYDGYLWIAEFYDGSHYFTKESHKFITATGQENNAFICAYKIDETMPSGIMDSAPEKIFSAPDKVQGIAFDKEGNLYISTSWGATNTELIKHRNVLINVNDADFAVSGQKVPVWYLDSLSLEKVIQAPPMGEGIVYMDGRLYVLYESATLKYYFGILTRGYNVYSIGV